MGYTRIVQYGDIIETYNYEKNRTNPQTPIISRIARNRTKAIRDLAKRTGTYKRKKSHVMRTLRNFFMLCHHNNCLAKTITFITFTFAYEPSPKQAHRDIAHTMARYKKSKTAIPISFISVFEKTKKGRIHAHMLVYDLPSERTQQERKTRNFQRLFRKGYVDLYNAIHVTTGIAGYMAKYMGKSFENYDNETGRTYTCSRNIKRPTAYGSNSLDEYTDLIIPEQVDVLKNEEYDVPYLGKCIKRVIKKI